MTTMKQIEHEIRMEQAALEQLAQEYPTWPWDELYDITSGITRSKSQEARKVQERFYDIFLDLTQ